VRRLARRATSVGLISVCLLVCAWAARAADPSPAQPLAQHPSLFISPMGQPFRSGPDGPDPVSLWFAQADRNGDGRIDRAEFRADAEAFFRVLDANHDGVIDGFEVSAYEHDIAPEILGAYRAPAGSELAEHHARPMGGGGGEGHRRGRGAPDGSVAGDEVMGGAAPYELIAEPEPVSSADTDLTGRVTLPEFLAAADRRFDQLDPKGLGSLTLAGLPKTPAQQALDKAARNKKH
jgi:hypothetical protein